MLPKAVKLRQNKYLNNQIEQDHHFIKRLVNPGMGFGSFNTARRTLRGFEAMNDTYWTSSEHRKGDILGQVEYARKILELLHNPIRFIWIFCPQQVLPTTITSG